MKLQSAILAVWLVAGPALASGDLDPVSSPATGQSIEVPAPDVMPAAADPLPPGVISRATFTSAIVDREPVDEIRSLTNDHGDVYFFTEFSGLQGQTLTHRWTYGGETVAEVPFTIGGPRWRVYSSKQLLPGFLGTWTVTVHDVSGRELARYDLDFVAAEPTPAAAEQVADDTPVEGLPSGSIPDPAARE
jgi:hypothetical protein